MGDDATPVTRLLQRWQDGERDALEEITPLIASVRSRSGA